MRQILYWYQQHLHLSYRGKCLQGKQLVQEQLKCSNGLLDRRHKMYREEQPDMFLLRKEYQGN